MIWRGCANDGKSKSYNSFSDIIIVVGTSLRVYPAAGLINYAPSSAPKFVIDTSYHSVSHISKLEFIQEKATVGLPKLIQMLIKKMYDS